MAFERGYDMGKQVKVIALIDEEQRKRLYHVLLDEDKSFAEWLRDQIEVYLLDRESGKVRFSNGKEGRRPPSGSRGVTSHYSVGGGMAGNVPKRRKGKEA
jgi:hypothetical protein